MAKTRERTQQFYWYKNFAIIKIRENINVARKSVSLATNLPLCVVLFYFRLVFSTLRSNITYDLNNDARRTTYRQRKIHKQEFVSMFREGISVRLLGIKTNKFNEFTGLVKRQTIVFTLAI